MAGVARDPAVGDALVPELAAGEEGVVGLDEAAVAPPVDREGGLGGGLVGGFEVGEDVGAPKGVDGLLRVADEHEGRPPRAEGPPHDLPLHRVGVLELVDEDDRVAVLQPGARRRAAHGVGQGVAQPDEDVVVGEDLGEALAPVELAADCLCEAATDRPAVAVLAERRHDGRRRVLQHLPPDVEGLAAGEHEVVGPSPEAADVEVVDDFLQEVVGVLDEGDVAFHVARRPEPGEDLHAETVGGFDGGGVEIGDRLREPLVSQRHLLLGAGGQQAAEVVVGGDAGACRRQRLGGLQQSLSHPLAQLARRHAGEGHDQQAVECQPVGHVAGGQGGDREGLARSGARLQQGHPRRERPAELERLGRPRAGSHRSTTSS